MTTDIDRAERAFKEWRSSRPHRSHTPSNLREMAIALVPHYPTRIICERLGVNSRSLKSWSSTTPTETFVTLSDEPVSHSESEVTLTLTMGSDIECRLCGTLEPEWIATVLRSVQAKMKA